ncbi:TonB-dependent receptor plug domain-containing protein [Campylobacter curvus]|uniref:TonB-dependent receptor plug domain-containing protein n=1 Tax=Campylobacter curvus TaxID=200 RepID=UPI0014702436|nr:TonB-dependent receptor [Campylobacter curvus]
MKKSLLMACSAALALHAQVFQLGEVEIIANKDGSKSSDNNVAVITQEDMQRNEIKRLSEVAQMTPGVYVDKKGPRAEQNFYVRGFDARRVPLFIDGIPVYIPYDGNVDFGRFTTFDLSRIDISKGSSSVLYGMNTMGGAINLITKKPTKELEGSIGYGFETGKNAKTYGNNIDFNIGSKQELFYVQAGGSYMEDMGQQLSHKFTTDVNKNEDGGRRENSVQRDKKFNIKFGFTPNDTDEYAISYINQKGEKEQPYYVGRYRNFSNWDRYWDWPKWDRESLYFLSHTDFGAVYLNTKIFHDTFKNGLHDFANKEKTIKGNPNSNYKDTAYGFGVEVGGDIGDNDTLKFATNYKHDKHKGANDGDPDEIMKDKSYSFGLENTYRFSDMTRLIAGVSYDVRDPRTARIYTEPLTGGGKQLKYFDDDIKKEHAFNYQAAIKHSFDGNDELSVSYAKKTYFPSMKDRYSERFRRFVPNPALKPEIAHHYELGYQRTFGDILRLESAVFYSKVKDAIGNVDVRYGNRTLQQSQNVDTSEYKGFEFGAAYFATKNIELGGNYSYINAKYKSKDERIYDLPKHKGFIYADFKIIPKFSIYASQELASSRWSRVPTSRTTHIDHITSGFGVTNLKFTYKPTENLSIDAGISNLFDRNYEYREGYPEEGRVFFSNIRYKF